MKLLSILVISILFIGCGQPIISVPKLSKIKSPLIFPHNDADINGTKVHMFTQSEYDYVVGSVLNAGLKANECIEILDNIQEANK